MISIEHFTSAAVSDRGLNKGRPQNEDSYLESPQHGLFVVADGVGGAQAGEVASQMAVEIIGEAFFNMGHDADPEDTMRIAIERANGAIFQMSQDLPQLASMATTLVALHVAGDIATIAHVGDSRIYRVDPAGHLFRETDDHSVVEEEVRAGRMSAEEALVHPSRNVISRALGAEDSVDPDIKMVLLHPATTFLLCSDGITRHIDDSEIEGMLGSDLEVSEICTRMKEICFERGAEDNLTAVIVRFPGERLQTVEEVTVATARSPFNSMAEPTEDSEISDDTIEIDRDLNRQRVTEDDGSFPVDNHPPSDDDDEAYLLESTATPFADEPLDQNVDKAFSSSSVLLPANAEVETPDPESGRFDYNQQPFNKARGTLGKVMTGLFLLIAGALIGGIGSYGFFARNQAPTPTLIEKSGNVPLTAFEETRRMVDADPIVYLNAKAATPQTADDFFWLGRAHMLTGKYIEAGREFAEAKNRLSQVDALNSKTMAAEIAMATSIINNSQAQQEFSKEIAAGNILSPAVANSNSSGNSLSPSR